MAQHIIRHTTRSQKAFQFASNLKVSKGKFGDKPLVLRGFQKNFLADVLEPSQQDDPTKRIVTRAVMSVARKNGKTMLMAVLVLLWLLHGDFGEKNGEIYAVANDRNQAGNLFKEVVQFVEASPFLSKFVVITPSTKTMIVRPGCNLKTQGSVFKVLSADAGRQQGLNPSLCVYDEFAQSKNADLYDAMIQGMGARQQPLMVTISTQADSPTHPLSELIQYGLKGDDPTIVAHLYAADEGCDILDEAQWYKANPALGDFLDLDLFRAEAIEASKIPSKEANFRLYRLNQQVPRHTTLIKAAEWSKCIPSLEDQPKSEPKSRQFKQGTAIWLALDMSAKNDLTALVAISEDGLVKSWFWKPQAYIQEHSQKDGQRYDLYEKQGWLKTCPGKTVDPQAVAKQIEYLFKTYDVKGIAYDRAYATDLIRELGKIGIVASDSEDQMPSILIKPHGQGFVSMGAAVTAFEDEVLNESIVTDGNPILSTNVLNAAVEMDPSGNRKFVKNKSHMRIDGAVALAMAANIKKQMLGVDTPQLTNPWESPDFKLFVA